MISLRNIHKRFAGNHVLRGVSLEVAKGEVCVLLGPSGGGKSTLLRTINGLETFDDGAIQVDEITLGPASDPNRDTSLTAIRKRVGMVFQQFHLFPHRSVLDNILEAPVHVLGRPRKEVVPEAEALLERVGMIEKIHEMPGALSGGQQQRAAIARALAMKPEVILFDEPTSALDPRSTAEVVGVISDLAKSGQTMIVVTHAMGFARAVGHRVHVMEAGRVAESGPPEQIFGSPQTETTRKLLAQSSLN
ncbi:amino acid ABC transporter ATP-binding protein [Planctomyces sp. SH-PL14]|uniref:amino acid ABC transporter ATP-binding protein n=1 Tax=Planctomyces sp. SH-PL14 TaxID=1632864 RepID=UPI00078EE4CB|nr:amino acid ABC transporter ATP-binding protein [Planctomyces sp. SH-PL14]AMV21233.1 Glutamine transport ATP-binding protein GlnQ [Planctomyces sp. SH-PL14]